MNVIESIQDNRQINALLPRYLKRFNKVNNENHYICPICGESMFYDEQHCYIQCFNCGEIHSLYDIAKQHFSIRNGVSIPHHLDAKRIINIVMNNNGNKIDVNNISFEKNFKYPGLYNPDSLSNELPIINKDTSIIIGYGFKQGNLLNKIFQAYKIPNYAFLCLLDNKPIYSIIKFLQDNKCYNKRIYLFMDSTQEHIKKQFISMLQKYHFNLIGSCNLTNEYKTFHHEFALNEYRLKQKICNYLDNFNTFKTSSNQAI